MVGDTAFIGLSPRSAAPAESRSREQARFDRSRVASEFAAVDLSRGKLLWRVILPPPPHAASRGLSNASGLVNSISVPEQMVQSWLAASWPSAAQKRTGPDLASVKGFASTLAKKKSEQN